MRTLPQEEIEWRDQMIRDLRAALKCARKRLEYYGTISDRRHFDHDLAEIYPKIDAALNQQIKQEG